MRTIVALLLSLTVQAYATCQKPTQSLTDYKTVTGVGSTYEEAKLDLHKKLPTLGIAQHIKMLHNKVSVNGAFDEAIEIQKAVDAKIEYLFIKECKKKALYYVQAYVPRNGISYLPDYPIIIPNRYKRLIYLKRICGKGNKVFLIVSNPFAKWESKEQDHVASLKNDGFQFDVLCGDVEVKITFNSGYGRNTNKTIRNTFDDFIAIHIKSKSYSDDTDAWRLELGKIFAEIP